MEAARPYLVAPEGEPYARFQSGLSKNLKCFIDGQETPADQLGPPTMNYGRFALWSGHRRLRYGYEVPLNLFISRVEPWFDVYVREIAIDLARVPDTHETLESAMSALGFPPLRQFLTRHDDLAARFFIDQALELNNLFAPPSTETILYSVNSLDAFALGNGLVRFGGVAFDTRK